MNPTTNPMSPSRPDAPEAVKGGTRRPPTTEVITGGARADLR
jgi:hypothetical protein